MDSRLTTGWSRHHHLWGTGTLLVVSILYGLWTKTVEPLSWLSPAPTCNVRIVWKQCHKLMLKQEQCKKSPRWNYKKKIWLRERLDTKRVRWRVHAQKFFTSSIFIYAPLFNLIFKLEISIKFWIATQWKAWKKATLIITNINKICHRKRKLNHFRIANIWKENHF